MPDNNQVTIDFNIKDFIAAADRMKAAHDQLPFVISNLLNDGAFKTRQVLVEQTWPAHVQVRNARFINAALHIDKASKHNLEVAIVDRIGHGHLQAHAKGGTKRVSGPTVAIPNQSVIRLGAHGVRAPDRPAALIARTPKRAMRITNNMMMIGRGGRLVLQYLFRPSVNIKKDVPFYEDFNYTMSNAIRTGFADAMSRAMATRR
jgi:hypothetical protein